MISTNDVMDWVRTASKMDMDLVSELIKIRRVSLARAFQPGDRVKFNGGPSRGIIRGKFVKLMQKNASVLSDAGSNWRVNPALLEADEAPKPVSIRIVPPLAIAAQVSASVQDADFEEVSD
jgi:hypothetical protein